jgi:hypothetical protein
MKKCIEVFTEKIFNPFLTDIDTYVRLSNLHLHQNISLDYVNAQLAKHQIDPTKVNLGILSKITFSEFSNFRTLTNDDIFIILINFFLLAIVFLKYVGVYEKVMGKISKNTKTDIKDLRKMFRYFTGFLYIAYSIYMVKLIFSNKQYILTSRIVYLFTYALAGITISISFFQNYLD